MQRPRSHGEPLGPSLALLGDRPHTAENDPLGFDRIATELCTHVLASRASTPFTLGIEAGWGMGKSSLMRCLQSKLERSEYVRTAEFNAWTANDDDALEGLLKTVLGAIEEEGVVRRTLGDERNLKRLRLATQVAGRLARVGDVVDFLWEQMSADPRARNELREIVEEAMNGWRADNPERVLCVFVDDLDRCSPGSVFELFEAIKLYLDAPGLVFVIAYDSDVVSEAILKQKGYSKSVTSRHYLEKIVQVVYRIRPPHDDAAKKLIEAYVAASGTGGLLDEDARSVITEHNDRNPRRIKRVINWLILDYQREGESTERDRSTWIRGNLLWMYFPEFAQLMAMADGSSDPVEEFKEYVRVRDILERGGPNYDEEEELLERTLGGRGINRTQPTPSQLEALEAQLDPSLRELERDKAFLKLLDGLGSEEERERLRANVKSRGAADWRAEVKDPTARKVLGALLHPDYEFRTVGGIAKAAGLSREKVQTALDKYPQYVRESPIPSRTGESLFAARSALRSTPSG